ncbi:MAG: LysM peptidoglycan-binding domain-containing protein [Alkalinema sp. RL_2_19]|nr:LysM peptidoglycan-binding domain-containing protein [Alkalinema sp. RL_2_19]
MVKPVVQPISTKAPIQSVAGHPVAKGETLWQIAQAYQVEVRALANVNRLSTDSVLKVGQVLQLPGAAATKPSQVTVNLKEISQSVPTVPVLALPQAAELDQSNKLDQSNGTAQLNIVERQEASVAALRAQRDRLQQSLAELGENVNGASTAFAEAKSNIANAAARQEVGALPVTRLANVPLPAIGGAEPTAENSLTPGNLPDSEALPLTSEVESADAVAAAPTSTPAESQTAFNPTPLLTEIRNLRNRYSDRQISVQPQLTKTAKQVVVIAKVDDAAQKLAPIDATRVEPLNQKSLAANPDFAGRKSESALSIELRNFVQPKLKPRGDRES